MSLTKQSLFEKLVPALVVLAIGLSFIVGMLWEKVSILEKNKSPQQDTANNQPIVPAGDINSAGGEGHLPVRGNKDAKVALIEFADFRCPFCEKFFSETEQEIIKNYVDKGKVKIAFRHFAFLGPASVVASNAAECANDQGKFWEYHDYLFKNQPPETDTSMYNTETLTKAATAMGMDGAKFRKCLDTQANNSKVMQDLDDGNKVGVAGTPAFFVNGKFISGAQPYSVFQQAIEDALKN